MKDYDVFLCHNSEDKPEIRAIQKVLAEHGVVSWMDENDLLIGKSWYEQIFNDIGEVKSIAVFLGSHGVGKIQHQEIENALRNFEHAGKPIIPVLLKGYHDTEPTLPVFIEQQLRNKMNYVDMAQGKNVAMKRLIAGIRRVLPNEVKLVESPALALVRDPLGALANRVRFRLWWIALHLFGFVAISLFAATSVPRQVSIVGVVSVTVVTLIGLLLSGRRQINLEGISKNYAGASVGAIFAVIASIFIVKQVSDAELLRSTGALATTVATGVLAGAAGGWVVGMIASIVAGFGALMASSLSPGFLISNAPGSFSLPTEVMWAALATGTLLWAILTAQLLLIVFVHHQVLRGKSLF